MLRLIRDAWHMLREVDWTADTWRDQADSWWDFFHDFQFIRIRGEVYIPPSEWNGYSIPPEFADTVNEGIARAFGVPAELLTPTESSNRSAYR